MDHLQPPKRRETDLIVKNLDDEILVYDRLTHEGYCLNSFLGAVWESFDGKTPMSEISGKLEKSGYPNVDEDLIIDAREKLNESNLLTELVSETAESKTESKTESNAASSTKPKMNRRALMRKLSVATMVPVITKFSIPSAFAQASDVPQGGFCVDTDQCAGNCICVTSANPPFCQGDC